MWTWIRSTVALATTALGLVGTDIPHTMDFQETEEVDVGDPPQEARRRGLVTHLTPSWIHQGNS